jgi:hypothetical protein
MSCPSMNVPFRLRDDSPLRSDNARFSSCHLLLVRGPGGVQDACVRAARATPAKVAPERPAAVASGGPEESRAMIRVRRHAAYGSACVGIAPPPTRSPAVHVPVAPAVLARFALERPVRPPSHRIAAPPRLPVPEWPPAFRTAYRTSPRATQATGATQAAQVAQVAQAAQGFPRAGLQTGIAKRIDSCRPESVSGLSTCPSRPTPLPEPARSSRERNPSPRVPNFRSLAVRGDSIADARWLARLRFVPTRPSTGSLIVAVGRGFLASAATGRSCLR